MQYLLICKIRNYHTDSSAGGDTVARQLESMEDKLDTILISLLTILPKLDKIDNVVQNLQNGQTVLERKIKAVDATMAEHSVMVIAIANETKVHLSREVLKLYERLSEANDNLSSQSHTLTSKVNSLSTQTQSLTSSVNTLASNTDTLTTKVDLVASRLSHTITSRVNSLSTQTQSLTSSVDTLSFNTGTLTTRVDLVASRMDNLTNAFTDSPLSIQVQNLTSLAGMAKTMLQDIQQDQTLSLIVDKIPYNVKSTFPCIQFSEDYPMANSGYYWMRDQTSSPVSTYCIINSELNPASSCQQLARDHPFGESDYYWVEDENGTAINTDCIITSQLNPASSCQQLARDHAHGESGYYWVKDENGTAINTDCIINSELNPASSCQQLARDHPHAASDYYWVSNGAMQPVRVYCDMDQHCCNSTGGWVRVANIDMTDLNQQCPPGFNLRTDVRSCDRSYIGHSCTPITFPSHSIEYRQVCGRIRAYQYWGTFAFWQYYYYRSRTIENNYVYGMSLTHGRHPRQHIWTFASAYSEYYSNSYACPCTRTDQPYTGAVPPFIGEDYFCDTGVTATQRWLIDKVYADDPLWDGQGCCSFNRPPWFCKQLPQPTTDDLELRVCGHRNGGTPFDLIEIYLQ